MRLEFLPTDYGRGQERLFVTQGWYRHVHWWAFICHPIRAYRYLKWGIES